MAPSIRVLHLITSLNTGGAEMTLLRLLTNMDRRTFETQVVCMIPIGPVGERIKALGIPVISLEMPPGHPTLSGFWQLLRLVKQFKPTILQTWLYHADLLGLLAAKLTGTPITIWNIRSTHMDFEKYGWISGMVFKICAFLSSWPKAVVVNSQAGKATHIQSGYHPKEWVYIPNGIDITQYRSDAEERTFLRQQWGISNDEILIGIVGRFDPMKDHSSFLRAASVVQAHYPNTRFACIGGGPQNSISAAKELASQLQLSGMVWTGPCTNMYAVYNALDILVSSSIFGEGFPNVVAEAMACETPCVVTDVGDAALITGNTSSPVKPGNPDALADAIIHILELSASKRAQLGQKARQRIAENFSIEKMILAYTALYEHLA